MRSDAAALVALVCRPAEKYLDEVTGRAVGVRDNQILAEGVGRHDRQGLDGGDRGNRSGHRVVHVGDDRFGTEVDDRPTISRAHDGLSVMRGEH